MKDELGEEYFNLIESLNKKYPNLHNPYVASKYAIDLAKYLESIYERGYKQAVEDHFDKIKKSQ